MTKKREPIDFERSLKDLETVVERMEAGELSLEDSLKDFERGVALARHCQKALADAEQKVKLLTSRAGEQELQAFASPDVAGRIHAVLRGPH